MRKIRQYHILFLLGTLSFPVHAQENESVLDIYLDSVNVESYRYRSAIKTRNGGLTIWSLEELSDLPQILGNSDPIRYAQMLPGIQTNGEYRSGINIEGCESQHNLVSIEGVPIYNVNHLLGFFSTFNASHYSVMSVSKGHETASLTNRLGGILDMRQKREIPDTLSGNVSVGLISSQGTIRYPLGPKTSLVLSLRGSYINLIYDRWLYAEGEQFNYSFYDANLTFMHKPNRHNTLQLDLYSGQDNGNLTDDTYLSDAGSVWGNKMGAFHWFYDKSGLSIQSTLYSTSYKNSPALTLQEMSFSLPSGITDVGIRSNLNWNRWNGGIEAIWHDIQPQSFSASGVATASDANVKPRQALETTLSGGYDLFFTDDIDLACGLKGSLFLQDRTRYYAVDPSVRLTYSNPAVILSASYALRHQYLFQTGFSDFGLPTEFWTSADDVTKPQYSHDFYLSGTGFLMSGMISLSVDLFYHKLYNQIGYKGSIMDFANTEYDLNSSLLHGNGTNYGFSVMANKCSGDLVGWVAYTYTRAKRFFDPEHPDVSYPASHERPHEFKAVATYGLNSHWHFGGTFVFASGTPFTAARYFYLMNGNVIMKYGEFNAARLRPYMRTDLSATYKWQDKRHNENGINLSLYNVSSRKNDLFYYLRKKQKDGTVAYRPLSFIIRVLPSISYTYKF